MIIFLDSNEKKDRRIKSVYVKYIIVIKPNIFYLISVYS